MNHISVTIKEDGRYKPIDLFSSLDNGIRKRLPKNTALAFKTNLVRNIESNRFGFKLSKDWLSLKKRKGWDLRPYIAEGHYIKSIEIFTSSGHLSVGFRPGINHPRANMSMGELARILEYGALDRNIPARPIWRKTAEEFFKEFPTIIKRTIYEELNKI